VADRRRARGSIGLYLKSCAAHPRTDDEKRVTYELVKNGTKAEDLDRLAEEYEHTPRPAPLAKTGNLVADIASFVDREQREGIVLRAQMMRENQAAYARPWRVYALDAAGLGVSCVLLYVLQGWSLRRQQRNQI
jgi:hypothetical protein